MLTSVGLDPDDASEDKTTPIGIGNLAGKAVVAFREHDGMNQLGDHGGRMYNLQPYADYTGFEPVNTAYDLRDPSKWQPRILPSGNGDLSGAAVRHAAVSLRHALFLRRSRTSSILPDRLPAIRRARTDGRLTRNKPMRCWMRRRT